MKKRSILKIFFSVLLFSAMRISAQDNGFFVQYDNGQQDICGVESVELDDGSFIVAAFDFYHEWFSYHDTTPAQLFHLSAEGELIGSVTISEAGRRSTITGLFADPENPDLFYAIGKIRAVDDQCDKPYLVKFDGSLNILSQEEFELPVQIPYFYMGNSIMDSQGDIVSHTIPVYEEPGADPEAKGRIYMRFGRESGLLSYKHDTINKAFFYDEGSLCEINDGSGDYVHWVPHREASISGLEIRRMDRDFNLLDAYPFSTITLKNGWNLYHTNTSYFQYVTMLPSGGDSIWFSTEIDIPTSSSNNEYNMESALFYKTDLYGHADFIDIINSGGVYTAVPPPGVLLLGYENDSIEVPARMKSFDVSPEDGNLIHCNGVYHETGLGSRLTITKATPSLHTVLWKRTLNMGVFAEPMFVLATTDGGCLITGYSNLETETKRRFFALKLNAAGTLDIQDHTVAVVPYVFSPNPVNDMLHFNYSPDVKPTSLALYDLQGRLVQTQNDGFENINMESLPKGIYTIRIIMEDGNNYSEKFIKQ